MYKYSLLVYTTEENSAFRARLLASSEIISQVLFTSEQPKKNWLPVSNKVTFEQVKLLFGPVVIQLVWYILKQSFFITYMVPPSLIDQKCISLISLSNEKSRK